MAHDIYKEREDVLSSLMRFGAKAVLVAYIPGVAFGILEGLWAIVIVDTAAFAAVVAAAYVPRVSFSVKLTTLVGAALLVGIVVLVETGPLGAGYIWFIVAVVMSALFGKKLVISLTIALSMTFMLAWSVALALGAEGHGATPATVMIIAASLLIACLVLAIVTRKLLGVLSVALEERERLASQLAVELDQSNAVRAELKVSLGLKESLLRELQHRVRNNLQSVQSLLAIDDVASDSSAAYLDEARRRISALTVSNDLFLSSPGDGRINAYELIRSVAQHIFDDRPNGFCSVSAVSMTEPYLDSQTAALVGVLASDLIAGLSATGASSILFEGRACGFRLEMRSESIVDPASYKSIYERVAVGRIARSCSRDISIGTLGPDGAHGAGIYLDVKDSLPAESPRPGSTLKRNIR